MTAQLAGIGAAVGLLLWVALDLRHLRAVAKWAQSRSRPRISWDDQPRATVITVVLAIVLVTGMSLQTRWGFGFAILLATAGSVLESAVRVVPHLRASEQRLAIDHVVMGVLFLIVLILAVMGWNRLPPLIPGT
jgi:hypothetical protein